MIRTVDARNQLQPAAWGSSCDSRTRRAIVEHRRMEFNIQVALRREKNQAEA
jgi:hypothetical protein